MNTPGTAQDLSDDQLKTELAQASNERRRLYREIEKLDNLIDKLDQEKNKRELDAFWLTHPGLRVEVGDKVRKLPQQRHKVYFKDAPYELFLTGTCTECKPDDVFILGKVLEPFGGTRVWRVNVETIRAMRQAYLTEDKS